MIDIKFLRDNINQVEHLLARRDYSLDKDQFKALDAERKSLQVEVESLQSERKTLSNDFGKLWYFKNGGDIPDIAYDGILPKGTKLQDPDVKLCIQNNENASFVFLDAANDFKAFSNDLTPFNCSLN